jgi:LacI family transcriptional regulator
MAGARATRTRRATIRDVADAAGVSIATVSNVVNGTRYVAPETYDRVMQAVERLQYRASNVARSLRGGRTSLLGLVVPDIRNPFFAEVARAIEECVFDDGYNVILCNSEGDASKEKTYFEVLRASSVDGVIFIPADSSGPFAKWLIAQHVPVVIVDRDLGDGRIDTVLVDNEEGGYQATKHLLQLGHERIACIGGPASIRSSEERRLGYERALREAGIVPDTRLERSSDFRAAGGEKEMVSILADGVSFTAIFACNDLEACGALMAIRRAGLVVPRDISIVGFDDVPFAALLHPALTTVAQPSKEIGRVASRLLLMQIEKARSGQRRRRGERVVLPTELVVRESTQQITDNAPRLPAGRARR